MKPSETIDQQEIQRFNQLAATWWNQEGPMWPLHLLNQFRVQRILEVLSQQTGIDPTLDRPLAGFNVLDIGCGGGILSETLAKLGAQVTGLDMADKNIAIARQHALQNGLSIRYLSMEIAELNEQFDLVFNMEVVEHVANVDAFMSASCARVKAGGIMFLSTINRTLKSYLFAILGAEYVLRLLPKGTHQWRKFVSPDMVKSIFHQHDLDTVWETGVSLNPFSRSYSSTRSMAVSFMLAAMKHETHFNGS